MKRVIRHIVLALALILGIHILTQAANITVQNNKDSGSGSLRDAITNANDGDTVTFNAAFTIYLDSQLVLGPKSITIDGSAGNDKVRLDGRYEDANLDTIDDDGVFSRIFSIIGEQGKDITIENLCMQHGSVMPVDGDTMILAQGGAMFIDMSGGGTVTVEGCDLEYNYLVYYENTIKSTNEYLYMYGGAICSENGGTFINCRIRNNLVASKSFYGSAFYGGGVYSKTNSRFINCLVAGNRLHADVSVKSTIPIHFGGGMYLANACTVQNCAVLGNTVSATTYSGNPSVFMTYQVGGGLCVFDGTVLNATIAYNSSKADTDFYQGFVVAGGMYANRSVVQNCIMIKNNSAIAYNYNVLVQSDKYNYNAVSDSANYTTHGRNVTGWIVLADNPFVEAPSAGTDTVWGTADDTYGDLRLKDNSPCIDAGDPDSLAYDLGTADFYGQDRIVGGRVDMGAAEYFVKPVTYGIKGTIFAGNGYLECGKVYVLSAIDGSLVDSCEISPDGIFECNALLPGEYTLSAVPGSCSGGYQPTYYGNVTDVINAEIIALDEDKTGMDIELLQAVKTFWIKGIIHAGSQAQVCGEVYAFKLNESAPSDSCTIASGGDFEFAKLRPGSYNIMAVPGSCVKDYKTTYFGNESELADAISITVDDDIYGIDIYLIQGNSMNNNVLEYGMTIYPNPAKDCIRINGATEASLVTIFNNLGVMVDQQPLDNGKISVTQLPAGLYTFSVTSSGNEMHGCFTKQ